MTFCYFIIRNTQTHISTAVDEIEISEIDRMYYKFLMRVEICGFCLNGINTKTT